MAAMFVNGGSKSYTDKWYSGLQRTVFAFWF